MAQYDATMQVSTLFLSCITTQQWSAINKQATESMMLPWRRWVTRAGFLFYSIVVFILANLYTSPHIVLHAPPSSSCLWCDHKWLLILKKKSNFAEYEEGYGVTKSWFIFIYGYPQPLMSNNLKQLKSILKKEHTSSGTVNLYIPEHIYTEFTLVCLLSATFSSRKSWVFSTEQQKEIFRESSDGCWIWETDVGDRKDGHLTFETWSVNNNTLYKTTENK